MNKKIIYMCVLVLINVSVEMNGWGFQTLQEMQQYAEQMPEYPKSDNDRWLQPDYTTFYDEHSYSWFERILFRLGLKKRPVWYAPDLKVLLLDLAASREQEGYSGRYVMHTTPKADDRFVIWGDIEGAFHSLVRDLMELERRGIIDNDLKIVQPNFSFVFNGNVVNRSPYILETLTIVLQLMKKNPYRVFYIRGTGEDRENWYNFGTKEELEAKAFYISEEAIPLDSEIKRFFNTLPLALYLIGEQTEKEVKVVRISNFSAATGEIDEEILGDFFDASDKDRPAIYKIFDRKPTSKKVIIAAVIKDEDRSWRYTQTTGLVRLGFEGSSVAWSLLSSPTSAYRNLYDFFWDAFAILRVKETLSAWTIALYNQDVRDKLGFIKSANFQLTTGFEIVKKQTFSHYKNQVDVLQQKLENLESELKRYTMACPVERREGLDEVEHEQASHVSLISQSKDHSLAIHEKKIILGATSDLKKGLRGYNHAMYSGSEMVFDKINNIGGFRGKRFELVSLNDDYEPRQARQNVIRFLDEIGTDIIFNPYGSPTTLGYLDLIKDRKILVLFPHSGTIGLRSPDVPYVINFQASYFKEGEVIARYAVEKTHSRRFGILYQNDTYGIPPRDGILKELKRQGVSDENIVLIPYDRNNVNLVEQATKLKKINPEAIFFLSTTAWAKSLIRYLGAGFFASKKNFAISDLSAKEFIDFMNYKGLPIIFTAQTPSPEYSEIQLVQEFREQARQHNIELDVSSLEGYIAAELFIYLLKRIPKNQPITKEAIINAARQIVNQDYKGLKLNYNPQTNGLNTMIWLRTQEGKDWQGITMDEEGL